MSSPDVSISHQLVAKKRGMRRVDGRRSIARLGDAGERHSDKKNPKHVGKEGNEKRRYSDVTVDATLG